MLNDAIVKKSIYDFFYKYRANGEQIIWADQAEARPQKPYVTLKILSTPTPLEEDLMNNLGQTAIKQSSDFTVSVNYYGERAFTRLARLIAAAEFPTQTEKWDLANVSYKESSGIRDLTSLMETKFETRAQADLVFGNSDVIVDLESTYIETVEEVQQNIDS